MKRARCDTYTLIWESNTQHNIALFCEQPKVKCIHMLANDLLQITNLQTELGCFVVSLLCCGHSGISPGAAPQIRPINIPWHIVSAVQHFKQQVVFAVLFHTCRLLAATIICTFQRHPNSSTPGAWKMCHKK